MMRALIFAAALLPVAAGAQTPAMPAGTQLNPNHIVVGTTPGTVAGGDALAALKALVATGTSTTSLVWDGQSLIYAVPNGPRVCVVVSPACPGLLPNAAAVVPANPVADGLGGHVFDPVTGSFLTLN